MEKTQNTETSQNLEIVINHHSFVISLVELVNLVYNKSLEMVSKGISDNLKKYHERLQEVSLKLMANFQGKSQESDNEFDEGMVVKKLYKTLAKYPHKLVSPDKENTTSDISLFFEKNENSKLITIIPHLEIGLVVKTMNEEEIKSLWGHLYILFISSAKMLSVRNNHKKTSESWKIIPVLQDRVAKMGLTIGKNKKTFNPYIGLTENNEAIDIENMFLNTEGIKDPEASGLLESLGIEKFLDIEKLSEQLKNCSEEEIKIATEQITSMLGASGDKDVNDVCGTLVNGIVRDIKENGLKSMTTTAESVARKVEHSMDKTKMEKTAVQLTEFMETGQEKLKNMKDEKGNPIGSNILKNLGVPLQFMKSMLNKSQSKKK